MHPAPQPPTTLHGRGSLPRTSMVCGGLTGPRRARRRKRSILPLLSLVETYGEPAFKKLIRGFPIQINCDGALSRQIDLRCRLGPAVCVMIPAGNGMRQCDMHAEGRSAALRVYVKDPWIVGKGDLKVITFRCFRPVAEPLENARRTHGAKGRDR